jgi:phospholipid/cholesterol/gamma-HCH transport system permease protein
LNRYKNKKYFFMGSSGFFQFLDSIGRWVVSAVEELGYVMALLGESLFWIVIGWKWNQPVKISSTFSHMMRIGIGALPIVTVLSFTIGMMLAIQGIHTLRIFGAESQVVIGIALSVTREFSPLIIGILVAGRSGSAMAAFTGTMQVSQEIDALVVMGINPIRYLVSPVLIAIVIMLPSLTFFADIVGLLGGAFYTSLNLGISLKAYAVRSLDVLRVDDIVHGLWKSVVFAIIITLVGFSNGFMVKGGAEGVGRAATRSVVLSITSIIIADMIISFYLNR